MNFLQMSFSGAVFITAIIVIRAAAINRLPKKTFLVLWELALLRLLIPFSIPSVFSAYTLIQNRISEPAFPGMETDSMISAVSAQLLYALRGQQETGGMIFVSPVQNQTAARLTIGGLQADVRLSVWLLIWLMGMISLTVYFALSYLRCLREFQTALPVHNDYVEKWLRERPLKRRILVKQSDRILTPLTYGMFRPVILLPKKTEWEDEKQLEYVLFHEYVHIYRFDTMTKLIATAALVIHWFNPAVWVMYVLFNRDMELACDESVIKVSGEQSKSAYSLMLISMEAKKSGLLPLCNSFSKNAMEERITAIMKMKKTSAAAICTAAILIVSVTAVFATSAADGREEKNIFTDTNFSQEEFDKLLALQFDGYEDMSVSEFQNKVWELTDTEKYRDLLEKFSKDTVLYEQKDQNETASFLFYTLEPLTAERWQTRDFGGYAATDDSGISDHAILEFVFSLTIQNVDTLTVGEYNAARLGVADGLQNILQGKTKEQLRNDSWMQETIQAEIEKLKRQWNTDQLQISVEYFYQPLSEEDAGAGEPETPWQEQREYPNGTEEDYRSLLSLKTADYQNRSVADFNMDLLEWANEDYERMERINGDIGYQDFAVDLNDDELSFVAISISLSGMENGKYVQSNYTGRKEEDPACNQYLPSKTATENGRSAWCDLFYQFSWHIADKNTLTIGERDYLVSNMINGIQDFWNEADLEQMLRMSKEDMVSRLKEFAEEYSTDNMEITIRENFVSFEKMDERNMDWE